MVDNWALILKKRGLTMAQKREVYELLGDGVKRSSSEIIAELNLRGQNTSIHRFLTNAARSGGNQSRNFPNVRVLPNDMKRRNYSSDRFQRIITEND